MPFIAETLPAFVALLKDVPFYLRQYGRKLYIHLTPDTEQTFALQEQGWELNGLIPGGYHPGMTTHQWSYDVDEASILRTVRVKERFLKDIRSGRKDLEVRVGYGSMQSIKKDEIIELSSQTSKQLVKIEDVRQYDDFDTMLGQENPERIAPGMTKKGLLALLREIYPPNKERLGIIVFQLRLLS